MIVHPGPVVDFLIANQNVRDPFSLDWNKVTKFSEDLFVLPIVSEPFVMLNCSSTIPRPRPDPLYILFV